MEADVIKQLKEGLRAPIEVGDGFIAHPNDWTVVDPATLIKAGPSAKTLVVSTLGAVRDYLKANRDGLDLSKIVVHVVSPSKVSVLGPLDPKTRAREELVTASVDDLTAQFAGAYRPLEDFLVGLQVRFTADGSRSELLRLLSTVKSSQVKSALDDGMTQVVEARKGVALVGDVAVPNPVTLAPFRTFRDVAQPASLFVVRLKSGREDGLPEAGVFEADGGAWKLTAIDNVKRWLEVALSEVSVLG